MKEPLIFKILSLPKGATAETPVETQNFFATNLEEARTLIREQRIKHQQKSVWFKFYQNNEMIFNSYFIHHSINYDQRRNRPKGI